MDDLHHGVNFVSHSQIEIAEAGEDRAVGRIVLDEHHLQPYGVVHGGVYCTLVETLASTGAALWAMSQGLAGCVGVSNSTDFLRSVRDGVLIGVATPVHRGRTQQLWLVEVSRESDTKLAARGQVRLQNITDPSIIGGIDAAMPPAT